MSILNNAFIDKVRYSPTFRIILGPALILVRGVQILSFQKTDDSKYIKKLHNTKKGQSCFIVGNGPSITAEDLDKIIGFDSFASNRVYCIFDRTHWRPSYYMALDRIITRGIQEEDLKELNGAAIFLYDKEVVDKYKRQYNIHRVLMGGTYNVRPEKQVISKVNEDVSKYFTRAQSVTVALFELAIYMGYSNIILLGIDHSFPNEVGMDGKETHNDSEHHFDGYKGNIWKIAYKEAITKSYEVIGEYCKNHGIRIINCTRGGNLELFERMNLDDLLKSYEAK